MGAAGSVLPTTEEDALAMGYTQEQIDEYLANIEPDEGTRESDLQTENTPATEVTPAPVDEKPSANSGSATTGDQTPDVIVTDVIDKEDIVEVKVRPLEERIAELGPGSINVNRAFPRLIA